MLVQYVRVYDYPSMIESNPARVECQRGRKQKFVVIYIYVCVCVHVFTTLEWPTYTSSFDNRRLLWNVKHAWFNWLCSAHHGTHKKLTKRHGCQQALLCLSAFCKECNPIVFRGIWDKFWEKKALLCWKSQPHKCIRLRVPLYVCENDTVKPVYNDHIIGYLSAFWSSSRWPRATLMSSRRQKLLARLNQYLQCSLKHITEWITSNTFNFRGGRYRQVSLYLLPGSLSHFQRYSLMQTYNIS